MLNMIMLVIKTPRNFIKFPVGLCLKRKTGFILTREKMQQRKNLNPAEIANLKSLLIFIVKYGIIDAYRIL